MYILAQTAVDSMSKNSRLVYSTETGRIKPADPVDPADLAAGDGWVRLARESKGRGGKAVTLIEGIPPDHQSDLCKKIKQRLGCGGSVKKGRIEIQGDRRPDIKRFLETLHFKVKISGG